jgi:hypothetical protein
MADLLDDARKLRLLDWLTTPEDRREPKSQNQLADEIGVTAKTLRNWRSEPAFRAAWEKQAKDIVGDPENVQKVLQMLVDGALDTTETLASRTRAAHEYLTAVDAIRPPAVDMAAKKAAEMSDDELRASLAELLQKEAHARGLQ